MWCGDPRETRESRVTIARLLRMRDILSNLPALQDLDGRGFWIKILTATFLKLSF